MLVGAAGISCFVMRSPKLTSGSEVFLSNPASEEEIRARLTAGDPDGLALAFDYYRKRLRQTIQLRMDRRLNGRLDPSDVLQEAFFTAARDLPRYIAQPDAPLFVWLHGVTVRSLQDLHREHLVAEKRAVSREAGVFSAGNGVQSGDVLSEIVVDSLTSPSSVILRDERRQQVLQGLAEIDEIDREILILRHFELLSNDETAMILGLSRTAASNRYIRSLQRLQSVLSEIMERT